MAQIRLKEIRVKNYQLSFTIIWVENKDSLMSFWLSFTFEGFKFLFQFINPVIILIDDVSDLLKYKEKILLRFFTYIRKTFVQVIKHELSFYFTFRLTR